MFILQYLGVVQCRTARQVKKVDGECHPALQNARI